jgi:hypothetical protein
LSAENQKRLPSPYEANNIQKRQSRNSKLLAFALERNQNKTKIITVYDIILLYVYWIPMALDYTQKVLSAPGQSVGAFAACF